ncbi:DNA cytosine methyltransferase [Tsukamurella pulmonis]|uniref:DNA cytosine methyltransferase n=1 Tax=Tsukamurella pulmonis TaxID=47312 RepID=UPI000B18926B|nr:DNA cytosine methyltransferase [Tsukamurella pulmonis]RDH13123.1 DNA cytosine methyltransferase [Tsukamurella pulmonis]
MAAGDLSPALTALASPSVVDLFAGPGGLDLAARALGVPAIGIELDGSACITRDNAGLETVNRDVRECNPFEFMAANVLTGGPPCQTFTVAGRGAGRSELDLVLELIRMLENGDADAVERQIGRLSDERTGLVLQPLLWVLRRVEAGVPFEAIVLEQVPAVEPIWDAIAEVLDRNGYAVAVGVLRTEEFGVPQTRRRAILIARWGTPKGSVLLPSKTHQRYRGVLDTSEGRDSVVSMGDVLSDMGSFHLISNYGTGGDPQARGQRSSDQPAFTVTGKVLRNRIRRTGYPDRNLTPDEAGQLQTFPKGFPWGGKDLSQQIGNAVPPRLGIHVLCAAFGWDESRRDVAIAKNSVPWSPAEHGTTNVQEQRDARLAMTR